jgi:hypothetical protein
MISNEGVFAISILDNVPLDANLNVLLAKFKKFYDIKAQDFVNNYPNSTPDSRKKYLEKMFLKGLKKFGFENKIAFFEGTVENQDNSNVDIMNIKWTKKNLEISLLGLINTVEPTPCN